MFFFPLFPLFSSFQLESSPSLLLYKDQNQNTTTIKQNNRKTSRRCENIWLHAASPDDISFYLWEEPLTIHELLTSHPPLPLPFLSLSVKCLFLLKDFHFHNEQEVITYHILCWDSSPPEYFKLRCLPRTPFSFPLSITLLTWLLNRNCQITLGKKTFENSILNRWLVFIFFRFFHTVAQSDTCTDVWEAQKLVTFSVDEINHCIVLFISY